MRSATDFLPRDISTLMNFATSVFTYFGSGRISRLGISLRRGMDPRANAALLRALLQRRYLAFRYGRRTALPHELIDGWHRMSSALVFLSMRRARMSFVSLRPRTAGLTAAPTKGPPTHKSK